MKQNDMILGLLPNLINIGYINDMICYITDDLFIYTFDDILYCMEIDNIIKYKYVTMRGLLQASRFLHMINGEIHVMPNINLHPPSENLYDKIVISDDIIRKIKLNFATIQ